MRGFAAFLITVFLSLILIPAVPAEEATVALPKYPTSIKLSTYALFFSPGGAAKSLGVTLGPEDAERRTVLFASSDSSVATVNVNGLVTPVGEGECTITASCDGGLKAEASVVVSTRPVAGISLSTIQCEMEECEAVSLLADLVPADAAYRDVYWSTSDPSIAVVNQNGKVFGKIAGECYVSAQARGGDDVIARIKVRVNPATKARRYIALTFDDGPGSYTMELLDILAEYDVQATFFMLGKLVEQHTAIVQRMAADGNELANHSYDHSTLTNLSEEKAREQLDKTDQAIYNACGYRVKVYRAPGGSITNSLAIKLDKTFIQWNMNTEDWKYKDAQYVYETAMNGVFDRAVVLMHDIHQTTLEAQRKLIPGLLEQGYTFVTVSDLILITGGITEEMRIYVPL